MIIETEKQTYKVELVDEGWSFATPFVYVKKPYPIIPLCRWVKVWEGDAEPRLYARKMHKNQMTAWFKQAVKQYEDWTESWIGI